MDKTSIEFVGTAPRRLTDLIGFTVDLTSGSGDKEIPVVFIWGFFDNLADDYIWYCGPSVISIFNLFKLQFASIIFVVH